MAEAKPKSSEPLTPVWSQTSPPNWKDLAYLLPKGYQWKIYKVNSKDRKSADVYALVKDGYDLARDRAGTLKQVGGRYVAINPQEPVPHLVTGTRTKDRSTITATGRITEADVGRRIVGVGIPPDTTIVSVDATARTAKISDEASETSTLTMSVGDVDQISYADEIVSDVWPVTQDYFYLELRKGEVGGLTAERECHSQSDKIDPGNQVVCGYFKIGNLLEIMQRLADMACTYPYQDEESMAKYCSQSIFGIGDSVPAWAEDSAPYQHLTGPYVWVPAHDPRLHPDLAKRDREAFFNLYKLYQMSLVDTSKLVTGAPAITIGK